MVRNMASLKSTKEYPGSANIDYDEIQIPTDLDLSLIHNPQYPINTLISTKTNTKPRSPGRNPPRPPNSFFLMKNCYMLELRKLGYRFTMPKICRQSKYIWDKLPQEVKKRYDTLSIKAQIIHQNMYPNYKFSPKPKNPFKNTFPPINNNSVGVSNSKNKIDKNIRIFSVNFCHETPIISPPLTPPSDSTNNFLSNNVEVDNYVDDNTIQYNPPTPPLPQLPFTTNTTPYDDDSSQSSSMENFVESSTEPLEVSVIPSNDNIDIQENIYYQWFFYNNNNNNNLPLLNNNGVNNHYNNDNYIHCNNNNNNNGDVFYIGGIQNNNLF